MIEMTAIALFLAGLVATVVFIRQTPGPTDTRTVTDKRVELITRLAMVGYHPSDIDFLVKVVEDDCAMTEDEMGWFAAGLIDQGTGLAAADIDYQVWCPDRLADWRRASAPQRH